MGEGESVYERKKGKKKRPQEELRWGRVWEEKRRGDIRSLEIPPPHMACMYPPPRPSLELGGSESRDSVMCSL